MTTATELSMKPFNEMRDEHILDQRFEHFLKRHKPSDPRDAMDFEVELHSLVRAIYAEATKPYEKTMSSMLRALPTPAIFMEKKSG